MVNKSAKSRAAWGNSPVFCCSGAPLLLFTLLAWLVIIAGCSVGMAMHGKNDPNLGAIRVGATRGEVELHLGSPVSSVTTEDGTRIDIYEYEIGNAPSGGRAVGHAVMDVLTLGIWEVVGTPIEAVQGKKYSISITYDKDNRVAAINQAPTIPSQAQATPQGQDSSLASSQKGQPAQSKVDIAAKLDEARKLRDKGTITEDEYKKMRNDILFTDSHQKSITTSKSSSQTPAGSKSDINPDFPKDKLRD